MLDFDARKVIVQVTSEMSEGSSPIGWIKHNCTRPGNV